MQGYCDLHTHSYYSDGTDSPKMIIEQAVEMGLSAVALCDHNTTRGLAEFMAAAEGKSILAIRGVEMTAEYCGHELHILGLFIPEDSIQKIQNNASEFEARKEQSNIDLAARLNADGYAVDYKKMRRENDGYINRAHFAAELTRLGYTESIKDAFKTLLHPDNKYYAPPRRPDALEMIDFLSGVGCVVVLAHPFLSMDEETLLEFLPKAKTKGLVGMETMYSKYSPEQTARAIEIARELGIKQSGGSDYHGDKKPDIRLGTGRGDLRVPAELALELKP